MQIVKYDDQRGVTLVYANGREATEVSLSSSQLSVTPSMRATELTKQEGKDAANAAKDWEYTRKGVAAASKNKSASRRAQRTAVSHALPTSAALVAEVAVSSKAEVAVSSKKAAPEQKNCAKKCEAQGSSAEHLAEGDQGAEENCTSLQSHRDS